MKKNKLPYLSSTKILIIMGAVFVIFGGFYVLPILLTSIAFQQIITVSYLALTTLLGVLFVLTNCGFSKVLEGQYEKEYYSSLKKGEAKGEGQNLRPFNPFKLTLAKRIYYAKLTLSFLVPFLVIFIFEYIYNLIVLVRGL